MATYIVLSSFTDQGIRTVKDTTKRVRRRHGRWRGKWESNQIALLDGRQVRRRR